MEINRPFFVRGCPAPRLPLAWAATFALAMTGGCVPGHAPAPPPVVTPAPPAPVAAPQRPASSAPRPADWRDLPEAAGSWRWQNDADGGSARFGPDGAAPLAILSCQRARREVWLSLPVADGTIEPEALRAATLTTSSTIATLDARDIHATGDGGHVLGVRFAADDRKLDAMAFSRGRFVIEITGFAPLVLPAWPEVGRVIESCRG